MKIVVLHWHGICPLCGELSCIYVNFDRDEDGYKYQNGYECDSCHQLIHDEEFENMEFQDIKCPKGHPDIDDVVQGLEGTVNEG